MSAQQAQPGDVVAQLRSYSMGLYFQDNWKVSPKLTLNLGLRYELAPGFNGELRSHDDRHLGLGQFIPSDLGARGEGGFYDGNPPVPLPARFPTARDGRFGRRSWKTATKQFAPRLGIAYSLNSKTVIRGGAGMFFPHDIGNAAFDILAESAVHDASGQQLQPIHPERDLG